jgi:sugar phosphate isomerase/epimerase
MGLFTKPQLVASNSTLSGAGVMAPARHTISARAEAAAEAGFAGIGLDLATLEAQPLSPTELAAVVNHAGVQVMELELVSIWPAHDLALAEYRRQEDSLYRFADAFGTRQITVTPIATLADGSGEPLGGLEQFLAANSVRLPLEALAERLAAVADRAARHDVLLALEPVAIFPFNRFDVALEVVRQVNRPNTGLLVDAYHLYRGPNSFDVLTTIPAHHIAGVQISDGFRAAQGSSTFEDCMSFRPIPGKGEFDLVAFLRVIADKGVDVPIGIEVFSDELRSLPVNEAASQAFMLSSMVFETAASGVD